MTETIVENVSGFTPPDDAKTLWRTGIYAKRCERCGSYLTLQCVEGACDMNEGSKPAEGRVNPDWLRMRDALHAWKRISGRLTEEGDGVPGDEIDAAIALTDAALGDDA